jgi:hypothetical protein
MKMFVVCGSLFVGLGPGVGSAYCCIPFTVGSGGSLRSSESQALGGFF